jgi:hypothetical protein
MTIPVVRPDASYRYLVGDIVMKEFIRPVFDGKCLELRCTGGEVCIYGNRDGMKALSEFCLRLANLGPDQETEHIHLEDYEILTASSLRGTIAAFRS